MMMVGDAGEMLQGWVRGFFQKKKKVNVNVAGMKMMMMPKMAGIILNLVFVRVIGPAGRISRSV